MCTDNVFQPITIMITIIIINKNIHTKGSVLFPFITILFIIILFLFVINNHKCMEIHRKFRF